MQEGREMCKSERRFLLVASVPKNKDATFARAEKQSPENHLLFSHSLLFLSFSRVPMLPDASCLLPPLARHAVASFSSSSSENNATSKTALRANEFAPANHRIVAAAAVELAGAPSWLNAALGPGLQCFEAASLGLPLEVK